MFRTRNRHGWRIRILGRKPILPPRSMQSRFTHGVLVSVTLLPMLDKSHVPLPISEFPCTLISKEINFYYLSPVKMII